MLMVISPAKTLDYQTPAHTTPHSLPELLQHSAQLITTLRQASPQDIAKLMSISDSLAQLNIGRYHDWHTPFTPGNAKAAVLAFKGDVYEGLNASDLGQAEIDYLQVHLRILSGLYGVLRPLDLMQAYRLEMGTRLINARGKNLYEFWGNIITEHLQQTLSQQAEPVLVNLASEEYFKSVKTAQLNVPVITPVFQDAKNGQYKIISFYAKRARGLMARWAARHQVQQVEQLKQFDYAGYCYDEKTSDATRWVFRREAQI
ncbi:peroxide stress protein YaaA [Neisseriaceae bacterium TC5R-5]|nr:peroxide stress protein YaaA [Neisseriaceae bacterium TC5R-5]